MRVSAACPAELATEGLVEEIQALGLQPIVTSIVVRAVYEGPDKGIGEAIVELFSKEANHEITVSYDKEEQRKIERKIQRKYERAKRDAQLHHRPFIERKE